jgi:hypothetical protein
MAQDDPRGGPRPTVSLADALVSLAALAPRDAAAREGILDLLGLRRAAVPDTSAPAQPMEPVPTPAPTAPGTVVSAPQGAVVRGPDRPAEPLPATLVRAARAAPARPDWLLPASGEPLPRASASTASAAPAPIFAPLQARGIYTAALSTWVREGDPDVTLAIRERGAGRPLRAIPLVPRRTLRRGVQLLLDDGPAMAPFVADVRRLDESLAALFGDGQIERLFFWRCPTRGVRAGLRSRSRPWRPPPRGVPVLVASEFGIALAADEDAAPPAEWLRFAREVKAEGHRVVGLVPFAPERWPADLADAVTFVHWSEQTIAGAVHRATREAQREAAR